MNIVRDIVDGVEYSETGGVTLKIVRTILVNNISTGSFDYMDNVFKALDECGYAYGDDMEYGAGCQTGPRNKMVLTDRSVKPANNDPGTLAIQLTYQHPSVCDSQPLKEGLYFRSQTTLQQTKSQFDANNAQVLLYYPWTTASGQIDPLKKGLTEPQVGWMDVLEPIETITFSGILELSTIGKTPDQIKDDLINKTNSHEFLGKATGTMLCTGIEYEAWGLSKGNTETYSLNTGRFSFEFLYKASGHTIDVIFIDERTGKPPAGITTASPSSEGFKRVTYYGSVDFNNYFPDMPKST